MKLLTYLSPGYPRSLFLRVGECLNADVQFDPARSGPAPGENPFASGEADLGWICSTSFVDLTLRPSAPTVQLVGVAWAPNDPGAAGLPLYFGDVVVPEGSPATKLLELRGARIGCNDTVSLSGHHSLNFALEDKGEDPSTFAELVFTGSHHESLAALARGEIDAAVVDSIVRQRTSREDEGVARMPVIERCGPWPTQPLVARNDLPSELVEQVRSTLLGAHESGVLRSEFERAALSGFAAVSADHCDPVFRRMKG